MAAILVAEDEPGVREFVSRALGRDGHEVTAVADGSEALVALAERKFDLLLSDIVMPELDGIALALKASEAYPDMPILLMSGFAAERQKAHDIDVIVHEVIPKPYTLQVIRDAAARILAERAGAQD